MGKQLIISIGREFGSGGHEIAERLAQHYGIMLLDHNLLDEMALERRLDVEDLKEFDEKHKNLFSSRTVRGYSSSPEENLYQMQFEYLIDRAENGGSFVIVGRCSETILKGRPGMVSVFVLADMDKKIERVMKKYQLNEVAAKKMICDKDLKRKRYHNGFCEGKWGDSRNYDISINSSKLGIDGTVEMLTAYIDRRRRG